MGLGPNAGPRSVSPTSSGRASPAPHASRRAYEDALYKTDKPLRRYAAVIERCLASWEIAPEDWADYIAFLSRLLKAIQSHPNDCAFLPHSASVASKLAQCLNPTLPSGVHQKALEVYVCIFSSFGQDFLSAHLLDFLPGLSGVLAFASLSVRPAVYDIYEDYILQFSLSELRAPLKSLVLGLLPAIEEESGEDFDRALAIIRKLEQRFAANNEATHETDAEHSGVFWQCLFLCIVTSGSRRQGALNYLTRRLPKTVVSKSNALNPAAEVIVSPEPGLLVRAFVAGLSDSQPLVQRGFLHLLVSHLPLRSPILDGEVESGDLDRLITAVLNVLLRRDMSLNRRIWSWFLGPDPGEGGGAGESQVSSPTEKSSSQDSAYPPQYQYFARYGRASLQRCVLNMFRQRNLSASDIARPFRICLSLMDRWEIGGSLVPRIFLPAIETAYAYSQRASATEVAEMVRSASLFFDGVEAHLIFGNFARILYDALSSQVVQEERLKLLLWICQTFNIREEEMVAVHIPCLVLYALSLLNLRSTDKLPGSAWRITMSFLSHLVELMGARAIVQPPPAEKSTSTSQSPQHMCDIVQRFYENANPQSTEKVSPFGRQSILPLIAEQTLKLVSNAVETLSSDRLSTTVPLMIQLFSANTSLRVESSELVQRLDAVLKRDDQDKWTMPFAFLQPTVNLVVALYSCNSLTTEQLHSLEPPILANLWIHLSPSSPYHHVEAARSVWKIDHVLAPDDAVKISLLKLLRDSDSSLSHHHQIKSESFRRFAVLWNHTIPAKSGSGRKQGSQTNLSDTLQLSRRQAVLQEPLLLALDTLGDRTDEAFEVVKLWLQSLPSLPTLIEMLVHQCEELYLARSESTVDPKIAQRNRAQSFNDLGYILSHLDRLLMHATNWTWQCLCSTEIATSEEVKNLTIRVLTEICFGVLSADASVNEAQHSSLSILGSLLSAPVNAALDYKVLETTLIDQLLEALEHENHFVQGRLLELSGQALKINLAKNVSEAQQDDLSRSSVTINRPSSGVRHGPSGVPVEPGPSAKLLSCLRKGFALPSSRRQMDQWLTFLARSLPTFADALLPNLIPLVNCFCVELEKAFQELLSLADRTAKAESYLPDAAIIDLFEGLEMTLARAHDSLLEDIPPEQAQKQAPPSGGFFGAVASGVFRSDSPSTVKSSQANSRLTVVLAFQDAIRIAMRIWTWASENTESRDATMTNAATVNHSAYRVRNKTRQLLEHIFAAEPLESLEVVIAHWRHTSEAAEADLSLGLLHTMQGLRPKTVLPTILDALCSRTNPSVVPPHQLSSQAVDLSAADIAMFLSAYVRSTEDDAMDEIWSDCLAFLRDVLSNPLPFRQVLPVMLTFVLLLAGKLDKTNYGEQRRMRRELGDVFQRLLTAAFTTMSSGQLQEPVDPAEQLGSAQLIDSREPPSLLSALAYVMGDIEAILESNDRIATAVNNISTNILAPTLHAKAFPANLRLETLTILLDVARKAPNAKSWKKELTDAFFDARFFACKPELAERGWFPVLNQWSLRDKERMPDLLSRLTAPSSAGIMFGVGANAARLEADRKTQLNLRRICVLLLASPEDTFVTLMNEFQAKVIELFEATHASSPSSAIKAELFLLCRSILLSMSPSHVASLWPIINENLRAALSCLSPQESSGGIFTNLSLVQACKLLDLLITTSPDDFQLHEWLYITDTIDAVYHPPGWTPSALSDRIAESLGASNGDESQSLVSSVQSITPVPGRRRPLLGDIAMDKEDLKALSQEECARLVLRPFLSQLSILAYEGVYSMEAPDMVACRRNLLDDLLDTSTMVG